MFMHKRDLQGGTGRRHVEAPTEAGSMAVKGNPPGTLAHAHGLFNVVGGIWPLLHRRSFEAVFGAKHDRWLQYTVAGLLLSNGTAQLLAAGTAEGNRHARRVGVGTALTLLVVDLVYAPSGRISRMYLADAAMEAGWLAAWATAAAGDGAVKKKD